MSLKPQPIQPIPDCTRQVAQAAFPKGNPYLTLRDELGTIFEDKDFEACYPRRGQPAYNPWRLALITLMQFREGLSDRQAADAVRSRIDWKYLLGLELTDPGFNFSILSEFRKRLLEHQLEAVLLDKLLVVCQDNGFIKVRGQQRTDATYVLGAVRVLTRLEQIGETLRAVLNRLAVEEPDWLQSVVPVEWYTRYHRRVENKRLATSKSRQQAVVKQMGEDALLLLQFVNQSDAPNHLVTWPEIQHLQHVLILHYEPTDDGLRFKSNKEISKEPPAAESPYDLDARHCSRYGINWFGYKAHLTETCDSELPYLLTHVDTTLATVHEAKRTQAIHQALIDKGLAPQVHFVDSAYVSGELLVESQQKHDIVLMGPIRPNPNWQAQGDGAYSQEQFEVDWQNQSAICPQGKTSRSWRRYTRSNDSSYIKIRFATSDCQACHVREQCTRSTKQGRQINLPEEPIFKAMKARRQLFNQWQVQRHHHKREGVEGTISQGVRAFGLRRTRYRGLSKTHLQHVATAAAMNISRLFDWISGVERETTRMSAFAALAPI